MDNGLYTAPRDARLYYAFHCCTISTRVGGSQHDFNFPFGCGFAVTVDSVTLYRMERLYEGHHFFFTHPVEFTGIKFITILNFPFGQARMKTLKWKQPLYYCCIIRYQYPKASASKWNIDKVMVYCIEGRKCTERYQYILESDTT